MTTQQQGQGFWGRLMGGVGRRLVERFDPWSLGSQDSTGNAQDRYFRPITQDDTRSLPQWKQERAQEISYYQWKTNPQIKQMIEQTLAYIVGRGISFRAVRPDTQDVVDQFVTDNELGSYLLDLVRYLLIFGEQVLPLFVSAGGRVRVGYIDPVLVRRVHLDSQDTRQVDKIEYLTSATTAHTDRLRHVRRDLTDPKRVAYEHVGINEAQVMYWSIYRPPNAERGTPYLFAAADWADILDQFLLSTGERAQIQLSHIWDVTINGANPKQCAAYAAQFAKPRPGQARVHNDRIKVEALAPKLEVSDISGQAALLKRWGALAAGFPPHWVGEEGSANRSTAEQMGVPTIMMLILTQTMVRNEAQRLVDFAVDQAMHAGVLGPRADRTVEVVMPTVWGVDTGNVAAAIQAVTQAMVQATQQGYMAKEEAGQVVRYLVGQLGLDLSGIDESTGGRRPLTRTQVEQMLAELEARLRQMGGGAGAGEGVGVGAGASDLGLGLGGVAADGADGAVGGHGAGEPPPRR